MFFFVNYLLSSRYQYVIYVKVKWSGFEVEDVSVAGVWGDNKHKRSSVPCVYFNATFVIQNIVASGHDKVV